MELPNELLEQIAFSTRPKNEEHMLSIMDKSTDEKHLSQPLQTNKKQFKLAVTFVSALNGIFNVTNSNNKIYFKKALVDEDFIQIRIPQVLLKWNQKTLKSNVLLSTKVITVKQIIHSNSN